jgi:hypothetical protein
MPPMHKTGAGEIMTDTQTVEPTPLAKILTPQRSEPREDLKTEAEERIEETGVRTEQPAKPEAKVTGEPPSPAAKAEETVPTKALLDERRKRQELERRFADLEKRLATPKAEENVPDPLTDPKGYAQHFETKVNVARFEDRLAITTESVVEKEGQEAWEAAEKAVLERARSDPKFAAEFGQGVAGARNPARYTFEQGKKLQESSASTDAGIDAIVQKAVAAALAAAGVAKPNGAEPSTVAKPRVPPSLADARSEAPGKSPTWGGPKPLKDILKRT